MANDEDNPRGATTRKDRLRRYLDAARNGALWKATELAEREARQPMTPTGSSILGIVNHLAFVEFGYFSYCLGRPVANERAVALFRARDDLAEFVVPADTTVDEVLQFYRDGIAAANTAFDELELDAPADVPWWGENSATTLEHLMVHLISETARHAGHLDILRELIDGRVGTGPRDSNLPGYDERQWREHYERLQGIADSL